MTPRPGLRPPPSRDDRRGRSRPRAGLLHPTTWERPRPGARGPHRALATSMPIAASARAHRAGSHHGRRPNQHPDRCSIPCRHPNQSPDRCSIPCRHPNRRPDRCSNHLDQNRTRGCSDAKSRKGGEKAPRDCTRRTTRVCAERNSTDQRGAGPPCPRLGSRPTPKRRKRPQRASFEVRNPAASYSPRESPPKYHRRWWA
jgi:hypothetical protein